MYRAALYMLFFTSGAAGLMYEIVWQRQLVLVFGASTLAISAVLAAFMGGLALGCCLFGRVADRLTRPLLVYGCVELGIGLSSLAVPFLMTLAGSTYDFAYHYFGLSQVWFNVVRFILCAVVLLIPTTLMGATFPLMGRLLSRSSDTLGRETGVFYGVNTFGAVVGCVLAGYVLIAWLGMRGTVYFAAALNVCVAVVATQVLSRIARTAATASRPAVSEHAAPLDTSRRILLLLFAISGFVAMGYQIVWTRLTAIYTTSNILAFTTIVAVFLIGIALGSWAYSLLLDRRRAWLGTVFAVGELIIGAYAVILLYILPGMGIWLYDRRFFGAGVEAWRFTAGEAVLSMVLVLLPTLIMGTLLPVVVRLVTDDVRTVGKHLACVYSANTVGAILGSCATGLVIVPRLGLAGTELLLAAVSATIGMVGLMLYGRRRAISVPLYALAGVAMVAVVMVAPPPQRFFGELQRRVRQTETVIHYRVGNSATVSVGLDVWRGREHKTLYVDSQDVASTYPTAACDAKMLAHVPLALHPNPQRALTVGFGSGGTSYSMCLHDIDTDCVEIEREVVNAATFFLDNNKGVMDNPRFTVVIDDARNYLQLTSHRYDVISTDCTNLQYKSNGSLYTTDYFALMANRLAPGGIATAWIPGGGASREDFRTLVHSFQTVFEYTSVWYVPTTRTNFFILIGTPGPLQIDLNDLQQRLAPALIAQDLAEIGIFSPAEFVACLLAGPDGVRTFVADSPVHTDNRPILEYSAAHSFFADSFTWNLKDLLDLNDPVSRYLTPQSLADLSPAEQTELRRQILAWRCVVEGHHHCERRHLAEARRCYDRAMALLPNHPAYRTLMLDLADAQAYLGRGRMVAAQ